MPRGFQYVTIDVPDDAPVGRVTAAEVPGWDEMPARASRVAGDGWIRGRTGLALLVPSAVTRGLDENAVINPLHPDFARVVVSGEQTVLWDERLIVSR